MTRLQRVVLHVVLLALGLTFGAVPSGPASRPRGTSAASSPTTQGAPVPGATVTVRNEATGVETVLVTNAAGAYTTPPLVLGTYTVTVDLTGFKKSVTTGILLQGGDQVRHDVTHAGRRADRDRSRSRPSNGGLSDTRPDVSHTVNEKYYRDLPIVTGRRRPAGRSGAADAARLPADEAQRRPDVPRQPVQLPHQRRPGEGDRELLRRRRVRLRGRAPGEPREHAAGRSGPGSEGHHHDLLRAVRPHQRRVHRIHVASRAPTRCTAASTSTSPTTRSTRRASSRSARRRCATTTSASRSAGRSSFRRSTTAATRRSSSPTSTGRASARGVLPGFGNTTPTDAFKGGDFSALLTGNQVGVDALGRPLFGGQIFDPGDDAPGQRRSGARSVSRATSFRPAIRCAARWPRSIAPLMVRPGSARHLVQRRRQSRRATRRGSSTRATSCSASITTSRRTSG